MNTLRIGKKLGTTVNLRPLGRLIWIVPILGLLLLGGGYWLEQAISDRMKMRLGTSLQTTLDANVGALRIWLDSNKRFAGALARSDRLRSGIVALERRARGAEDLAATLGGSPELAQMRDLLGPFCEAEGFEGFTVVDRNGRFIADLDGSVLGGLVRPKHFSLLEKVISGQALVTPPIRSDPDRGGLVREAERRQMFAAAPVLDDSGEVIAALALWIDPETEFTGILQVSRPGRSGETYAFDSDGLMVSRSRFDEEMRAIGLLPESQDVHSTLNIEIRDPGGDLSAGYKTVTERRRQPLTRMASDAVSGRDGIDVNGYRDYRGVDVIGAWTWLADYDLGVAFEIDDDEAFAPVHRLRNLVWGLFGLLAGATLVILLSTLLASTISSRMSSAIEEARRLGQYTLKEKIGEGGMGEVYKASHAMLRRPTAIKLLRSERTGTKEVRRFEREVQMTSRLTHPNTVSIFDFGRTSDGVFYYAMEYLPGVSLERLVRRMGPLPPSRVIHVLRQVCDSLREAHDLGLIHRDVKPANIFLCERGGVQDVAKVLDFGIVKTIEEGDVKLTAANVLSGTPQYLSPEGIRTPTDVDARADLYAVGAVGYFMLTGSVVFDSDNVMEICSQHLREQPEPPSDRLGRPVPDDLERLILQCLSKDRELRPRSAALLYAAFGACKHAGEWDRGTAERWWKEHGASLGVVETGAAATPGSETVSSSADHGGREDTTVTQTLDIDKDAL